MNHIYNSLTNTIKNINLISLFSVKNLYYLKLKIQSQYMFKIKKNDGINPPLSYFCFISLQD